MPAHTHRNARARIAFPADRAEQRRLATALSVVGPVAGAVLGRALGSYDGVFFAVCCLGCALVAAVLATPAGLWWAVPGVPLAIWAVGVAAELAWHEPPYRSGQERAVGVAHAMVHVFPVMGVSVIGMVTIVALRRAGVARGLARRRSARG